MTWVVSQLLSSLVVDESRLVVVEVVVGVRFDVLE
jgi:hypothetical protein